VVEIIVDSISATPPELAEEYDITVLPYHLIFDGKDYLDDAFDREELLARLKSYQNLPTTSACTTGEILEAYKKASQKTKDILYISISTKISADYNAALQAKEAAKKALPDTAIEVVDSQSWCEGTLLIILAAAKAAKEGKSLSEVAEIARQTLPKITNINLPDALFFLERAGRSGGEPCITQASVKVYPLMEIDASTNGTPKFISKHRTKAKAINELLQLVRDKSGGKKLYANIGYTGNPEEAEALKKELLSRFEVSELHITPWSPIACVVGGLANLTLGFYTD